MSGAAAVTGGAGTPSDVGGGSAGEAGAGDAAVCDPSPLDAAQVSCSFLGPPSAEACVQMEQNEELSGWPGCYHSACHACTKMLRDYPYYFDWHPCCKKNDTCASNEPVQCATGCPEPTERDKHPRCIE